MPYQYSPVFMQGPFLQRDELIERYFNLGLSYLEIAMFLNVTHGMPISMRQLKRILQSRGLRRRRNPDNIWTVVTKIQQELNGSGKCIGYRQMHQRLRVIYGLVVSRETVRRSLRILDPIGVEDRSRRRLRHREYRGRGPNFIWHLDGYDKLKVYMQWNFLFDKLLDFCITFKRKKEFLNSVQYVSRYSRLNMPFWVRHLPNGQTLWRHRNDVCGCTQKFA